jgi:hypothetical protein
VADFLRAADVENYWRAFDTYSDYSPMRSPTRSQTRLLVSVPATVPVPATIPAIVSVPATIPAETGGIIKNEKEPLLHED